MTVVLLLAFARDDTEFPAAANAVIVGDSYGDVVQILDAYSVDCHGTAAPTAGLDLEADPCAAMVNVASSRTDPYAVPGNAAASVLWNRVADTGTYGGVMRPGAPMPAENVDTVAAWIDGGANCTESVALLHQAGSTRVAGGGW